MFLTNVKKYPKVSNHTSILSMHLFLQENKHSMASSTDTLNNNYQLSEEPPIASFFQQNLIQKRGNHQRSQESRN